MPASGPPTHSKCACIRLRRAARSVSGLYDDSLRPWGLKITQFSALRNLQRLGAVSISELADQMALDRSTLGRNLLVLKRRGLVKLGEAADLRQRPVELTARAERVLEEALPGWEAAQARVRRKIGADGMATLFELLGRLEQAG